MRVALTGASGFIGSYTARRLKEGGHAVTALVRQTSRRDHIERYVDRFVVGAQADRGVWPELVDGVDCVIHNSVDWSAMRGDSPDFRSHLQNNVVGSLELLKFAAPRQFVFVSTIAVHADMHPREFNDRGQGVIDEFHPLRPNTEYGAYKATVEAHLWAEHQRTGQHTCAVRPCAVYGIDPNLPRSYGYSTIDRIRAGEEVNRPGGGKFVHVDDVAAVIAAVVGNPDAAGRTFNLVDCYARWGDWATYAAKLLGVDADFDLSSPAEPKNVFLKDAVQSLGVRLDRGHEGIKAHLRKLIAAKDA